MTWLSRLARLWLLVLLLVGLAAPFVANDVPVVASVGGVIEFPAVSTIWGEYPTPPVGGGDWKAWGRELAQREASGDGGDEWAWWPLWPYGPHEGSVGSARSLPATDHPFGIDDTGHDVLARVVHGASTAVWVGLGSTLLALLLGVLLGGIAGYARGWVDVAVLRLIEVFLCYPAIFLILALAAVVGNSVWGLVVMLALATWPGFARLVRGELLSLRERPFVDVARGLGVSTWGILWRHLLPQVRGTLLVAAGFAAAQAIAAESALSFLGLGPGPRAASWGALLAQSKDSGTLAAWHLWAVPSALLVVTVAALHGAPGRRAAAR